MSSILLGYVFTLEFAIYAGVALGVLLFIHQAIRKGISLQPLDTRALHNAPIIALLGLCCFSVEGYVSCVHRCQMLRRNTDTDTEST
jgi:MFS superfamily sulfate permease-like transporter